MALAAILAEASDESSGPASTWPSLELRLKIRTRRSPRGRQPCAGDEPERRRSTGATSSAAGRKTSVGTTTRALGSVGIVEQLAAAAIDAVELRQHAVEVRKSSCRTTCGMAIAAMLNSTPRQRHKRNLERGLPVSDRRTAGCPSGVPAESRKHSLARELLTRSRRRPSEPFAHPRESCVKRCDRRARRTSSGMRTSWSSASAHTSRGSCPSSTTGADVRGQAGSQAGRVHWCRTLRGRNLRRAFPCS